MQSIVKKHFVQVDGPAPSGAPRPTGGSSRCVKSVRLLRIDSIVQALEVTCSCGEATVVELEYPSEKESA